MTVQDLVDECTRQGIPLDRPMAFILDRPMAFIETNGEDPDYLDIVWVRRVHATREMVEIGIGSAR